MSRHYQVAGLLPGNEILAEEADLRVDVSAALLRPFSYNDAEILGVKQRGEYIWVSGGGTWLLNDRYVPLVRRPMQARVNPGRYSLFTGRADNTEELLNPSMLVRELFEELVLFDGKQMYKPECDAYQEIIDRVYSRLEENLGFGTANAVPLRLDHLLCAPRTVLVSNQGERWEGQLDCHVSGKGEINILFVLAGVADIDRLRAIDGEYYLADGRVVRQNRDIFLYDLHTATARDITMNSMEGEPVSVPEAAMTEHLSYLIDAVKRKLAPQ